MDSDRPREETSMMTSKSPVDDVSSIATLPDAINFIKFLKVSHKAELTKWMEACKKQAKIIKKLESNRHQELAYLSNQLHKYEFDLLSRENDIARQIAEKDEMIDTLNKTIDSLQQELKCYAQDSVSGKTRSDCSDSGIVADKTDDDHTKTADVKEEKLKNRGSSFSMKFFRKIDFSPNKSKAPDNSTVVSRKKKSYSFRSSVKMWKSQEKSSSDDETSSSEDTSTFFIRRPHKMDESMTNRYCEEPSESEREKMFDRVMARASVRKPAKISSKYQKISRNKSKFLEGLRSACEYSDSSN